MIKKLTPLLIVQFHEAQPLGEGSRVELTMWAGPVPIRWLAIHENVRLPSGFTDRQEIGPFKAWRHHHKLREVDSKTTEVIDEVSAEFGGLVSRLIWLGLPLIFAYRAWITRRLLEHTT